MILVRLIIASLPEKQKEVLLTLISIMETGRSEKGCLSYDVFYDIEDNTVFNLIEEWELREDLERHILSERFSILLGTKSLLAKPIKIKIHTVSSTEGEEVIKSVRGKIAGKIQYMKEA